MKTQQVFDKVSVKHRFTVSRGDLDVFLIHRRIVFVSSSAPSPRSRLRDSGLSQMKPVALSWLSVPRCGIGSASIVGCTRCTVSGMAEVVLALLHGIMAELVERHVRRVRGMQRLELLEERSLGLQHFRQKRIEGAVELIVKPHQLLDLLLD